MFRHICITSQTAVLCLIWSFCIGILYGIIFYPISLILHQIPNLSLVRFGTAMGLCFYPLSGYLADNVIGRYKVILRSLQLLIITLLASVLPIIVFTAIGVFLPNDWAGIVVVTSLIFLANNVSFIGFNANIIQFGIEQLHDSPTHHQSLFVYWYVWIHFLVQLFIVLPINTIKFLPITSATIFGALVVSSFMIIIVSLCVANRNKHWFLITSNRVNPCKLVYKITQFARHHKIPIRRSAFTYCEDDIPTGLNLAKNKYGGPYTTEEVENAKAFWGILKVLFTLCPIYLISYAADISLIWYVREVGPNLFNKIVSHQVYLSFFDNDVLSSLVVVLLIPAYLLIRKYYCCFSLNMLRRLGFGIFFLIMTLISITALTIPKATEKQNCLFPNFEGQFHNPLDNSSADNPYENFTIIETESSTRSILLILPKCLYGISNMLMYTALYEFICAQSPSSMKGLLIGLSFAIRGVFQAFGTIMIIPFGYIPPFFPSCGMLYYGLNTLLGVIALIIFVCVARTYKYRQRDEICNIYQYAEEYYSKLH